MKNLFFQFCLLILIVSSCNAQEICEEIEVENYSSYNTSKLGNRVKIFSQESKYDSLITEVLNVVGLPNTDIEINKTVKFGAFSIITKNCKRRFFLYNEEFFDSVYNVTNSYNCIKSICFHELAHHFYRHPLKSKWEAHIHEIEADRYSGFQMRLIGATIDESIAAMTYFGNNVATHSHPNKEDRIKEIKSGYFDASSRLFKDKQYEQKDSLYFYEELLLAIEKLKSSNESFNKSINESAFLNKEMTNIFSYPTYNLAGNLISVNENNDVLDLESNEIVGKVVTPYENAPFVLLKFEYSTYQIEENTIYSLSPNGIKIKLGTKIN